MRERDNQEFRLVAAGVDIEFLAFDNTAAILQASRIMRELVSAKDPEAAGFVVYRRQSIEEQRQYPLVWEIIHRVEPGETPVTHRKDIQTIEFIGYDGKSPTLCAGTLVFETVSSTGEKTKYSWYNCLISGGSVTFDNNWSEKVTKGQWRIKWRAVADSEDFDSKARLLLTKVVNANVPRGCCGGCV